MAAISGEPTADGTLAMGRLVGNQRGHARRDRASYANKSASPDKRTGDGAGPRAIGAGPRVIGAGPRVIALGKRLFAWKQSPERP